MCAKNRERLVNNLLSKLDNLEKTILLMQGSFCYPENDSDTNYSQARFEANFTYLFGLEQMNVNGGIILNTNEPFLIEEENTNDFYHKRLDHEEIKNLLGIEKIIKKSDFPLFLKSIECETVLIHKGVDPGSDHVSNYFKDNEITSFLNESKIKIDEDTLYPILNNTRTIKSEEEMECMREIMKISSLGHIEVMKQCKVGMYEYQIEAIFLQKCSEFNISQNAYYPICGSGKDCSILHYLNNDKQLKDGDLMLCDMGAKKYSVCSDITTSFPVNGKFTQKQKDIYNIVLEAQLKSIKAMKPNMLYSEISRISFMTILEGLVKLGLLKGDLEEMYNKSVHYYFMPHSLSHYIGFKVHDVGFQKRILDDQNGNYESINYKQYTSITQDILYKGIVTTVEPGIYFIDVRFDQAKSNLNVVDYFDFEKIEEYKCVGGIRIEDCVYLGPNGPEVLTRCPRTVEEIEKCMKGDKWD